MARGRFLSGYGLTLNMSIQIDKIPNTIIDTYKITEDK